MCRESEIVLCNVYRIAIVVSTSSVVRFNFVNSNRFICVGSNADGSGIP